MWRTNQMLVQIGNTEPGSGQCRVWTQQSESGLLPYESVNQRFLVLGLPDARGLLQRSMWAEYTTCRSSFFDFSTVHWLEAAVPWRGSEGILRAIPLTLEPVIRRCVERMLLFHDSNQQGLLRRAFVCRRSSDSTRDEVKNQPELLITESSIQWCHTKVLMQRVFWLS